MGSQLGSIEYVDPRDYWRDEAREFTPWLASEEGVGLLSDELGLGELELVGSEVASGAFKADMLLRVADEETHLVVVENQLDRTNHDHLGKLITYAACLGARTAVWVAPAFSEDHRRAVDWLNESAGESTSFYALEVSLLRIEDSLPAAQLKIVAGPNASARRAREPYQQALSETRLMHQQFWQELKDYSKGAGSSLSFRTPPPVNEYRLAIGSKSFSLKFRINAAEGRVGCQIYIRGEEAKRHFDELSGQRTDIEREIGSALEWNRLDGKQDCWIALFRDEDVLNSAERDELKEWFRATGETFHRVFAPRIERLKRGSAA